MQQENNASLIALLDFAMMPPMGETPVVDFTAELFRYLGYAHRYRLVRTRVDIPLNICGEVRLTTTAVCLVDHMQDEIMLLVQEDKNWEDAKPTDARAQLVAEAIAAFIKNNVNRNARGLPPLVERVVPGIVMAGTMPTFFKIPVTQTLATHIALGTCPPAETVVNYCDPPVPRPARCRSEGMKPLDNRREVLKCCETFKVIVGI